jgi:hypothetical protein
MSLHDAWVAEDEAAAAQCATPEAVTTLFDGSPGPADDEFFAGCFTDMSPITCSYAYTGGAISFALECNGSDCDVTEVSFIAD